MCFSLDMETILPDVCLLQFSLKLIISLQKSMHILFTDNTLLILRHRDQVGGITVYSENDGKLCIQFVVVQNSALH